MDTLTSREATIRLNLDSKQYESGITSIGKLTDQNITTSFGNASKSADEFASSLYKTSDSISGSLSKLTDLDQTLIAVAESPFTKIQKEYEQSSKILNEYDGLYEQSWGFIFKGFQKDAAPFIDKLERINELGEDVIAEDSWFGKLGEVIQKTKPQLLLKNINEQLEILQDKIKNLNPVFEPLVNNIEKIQGILGKAEFASSVISTFEDISDTVTDVKESVSGMVDTAVPLLSQMAQGVVGLQQPLLQLKIATGIAQFTTTGLLKEFSTAFWKAPVLNVAGLAAAMSSLVDPTIQVAKEIGGFNDGLMAMQLSGANTQLADMAYNLGMVGENLLFNTQATQQYLSVSISLYQQLEKSILMVRTLSVAQTNSVKEWQDMLQNAVSGDLKNAIDSTTLASNVYQNLSAGAKNAAAAIEQATVAVQYATATNSDALQIQNSLNFSLKATGRDASEAGKTMEQLDIAVQKGILTGQSIANYAGQYLSVLKSAGIDAEESIRDVALASQTLGDDGFLALQRLSESLTSMTPQAKKAAQEIGVNVKKTMVEGFNDGTGAVKGLLGVVKELQSKLQGNSEALREIVPESIAFRGAIALMNSDLKEANGIMGDLEKSTGEGVKKMFDESQQTVEARSAALSKGFTEYFTKMGQQFQENPLFKSGLGAVEGLLERLQNAPPIVQKIISGIVGFNLVLGKSQAIIGSVTKVLLTLLGILVFMRGGAIWSGFMEGIKIVTHLKDSMGLLQKVTVVLGSALNSFLGIQNDLSITTGTANALDVIAIGIKEKLAASYAKVTTAIGFNTAAQQANNAATKGSFLAQGAQMATKAWAGLTTAFTAAGSAIGIVSQFLIKTFQFITKIFTGAAGVIMVVVTALIALTAIIKDVLSAFGKWGAGTKEMNKTLDTLSNSASIAAGKLAEFNKEGKKVEEFKVYNSAMVNWIIRPLHAVVGAVINVGRLLEWLVNIPFKIFAVAMQKMAQGIQWLIEKFFGVNEIVTATFKVIDKFWGSIVKGTEFFGLLNQASDKMFENFKDNWEAVADKSRLETMEKISSRIEETVFQINKMTNQLKDGGADFTTVLEDEQKAVEELQKQYDELNESGRANPELLNQYSQAIEAQKKQVEELTKTNEQLKALREKGQGKLDSTEFSNQQIAEKKLADAYIDNQKRKLEALKKLQEQARSKNQQEVVAALDNDIKVLQEKTIEFDKSFKNLQEAQKKEFEFINRAKDNVSSLSSTFKKNMTEVEKNISTLQDKTKDADVATKETVQTNVNAVNNISKGLEDINKSIDSSETKLGKLAQREIKGAISTVKELQQLILSMSVRKDEEGNIIPFNPDEIKDKVTETLEQINTLIDNGAAKQGKELLEILENTEVAITTSTGKVIKQKLLDTLSPEELQAVVETMLKAIDKELEKQTKGNNKMLEIIKHQVDIGEKSKLEGLKESAKQTGDIRKKEMKAIDDQLKVMEKMYGKDSEQYKDMLDKKEKMMRDHKEAILKERKEIIQAELDEKLEKSKDEIDKLNDEIELGEKSRVAGLKEINKQKSVMRKAELEAVDKELKLLEDMGMKETKAYKDKLKEKEKLLRQHKKDRLKEQREMLQAEFEMFMSQQEVIQSGLEKALYTGNKTIEEVSLKRFAIDEKIAKERVAMLTKELALLKAGTEEYNKKLAELNKAQAELAKTRIAKEVYLLEQELKKLNLKSEISIFNVQKEVNALTQISKRAESILKMKQAEVDLAKQASDITIQEKELELRTTNDIVEQAKIQYEMTLEKNKQNKENLEFELESKKIQIEIDQISRERAIREAIIGKMKLNQQITELEYELKKALVKKDVEKTEIEMIKLKIQQAREQARIADEDAELATKEAKAAEKRRQRELDLINKRLKLNEKNGAIDAQIAKENILVATLEKQTKQLEIQSKRRDLDTEVIQRNLTLIDNSLKRQQELSSSRKGLFDSYMGQIQTQYQLLSQLTTSERRKEKLDREAKKVQLEFLKEKQKMENFAFELGLRQNQLALKRQEIEAKTAVMKQKAELLSTELAAKKVLLSSKSTAEEKELAQLQIDAAKQAYDSSIDNLKNIREQMKLSKEDERLKRMQHERDQKIQNFNDRASLLDPKKDKAAIAQLRSELSDSLKSDLKTMREGQENLFKSFGIDEKSITSLTNNFGSQIQTVNETLNEQFKALGIPITAISGDLNKLYSDLRNQKPASTKAPEVKVDSPITVTLTTQDGKVDEKQVIKIFQDQQNSLWNSISTKINGM